MKIGLIKVANLPFVLAQALQSGIEFEYQKTTEWATLEIREGIFLIKYVPKNHVKQCFLG